MVDVEGMVHTDGIASPETSITWSPVYASSSKAVVGGSEDAKTMHIDRQSL